MKDTNLPLGACNTPLTKSFETYWEKSQIFPAYEDADRACFDKTQSYGLRSDVRAIMPIDIPFHELLAFVGKKTRITITEVK